MKHIIKKNLRASARNESDTAGTAKQKTPQPVWYWIVFCLGIAVLMTLIVFDIFDLPSKWGFHTSRLNLELESIVIANGVVVLSFWLGYILINRRQIDKENNQELVALYLLKDAYTHCQGLLNSFVNEGFIKTINALGPKPSNLNDPILSHFRTFPFVETNDTIIALAQNGIIDGEQIGKYLDIKQRFASFVDAQIIRYQDNETIGNAKELLDDINEALNVICKKLRIDSANGQAQNSSKETISC